MNKFIIPLAIVAALLLTATASPAGTSSTINITLRVEKFAEWADASPVIVQTDWSGPINKIHQSQTVAKSIILYTNTDTVIAAKPGLNNGILTNGDQTLATSYKISGAVTNPDSIFTDPTHFFSPQNSYTIVHQPGIGAYTINLEVQATSPTTSAPDEGQYTCGLTLTAAW